MQSIDWIETYAYGMSKDLVSEKRLMIEFSNIIKRYKNDELWWYYKRNHKRT